MSATCVAPRWSGLNSPFFNLSRRRELPDGTFRGVISIAVAPNYFDEFYSRIGRSPGSYYAMAREDGVVLARYPARTDPMRNLGQASPFGQAVGKGLDREIYTAGLADRRRRAPHRLSQARGLSGLCARRQRDLGDPRRVALDHGQPPDLRAAGHAPAVRASSGSRCSARAACMGKRSGAKPPRARCARRSAWKPSGN